MSKKRRIIFRVDGNSQIGLGQVVNAKLELREATKEDTMLLFAWANDPEVRKNSFNPNPIKIEDHINWFKAVLENEQVLLYIAESDGKPVAHIRFRLNSEKAIISYLIDAEFRGQGIGFHLLFIGLKALKAQRPAIEQAVGLVQRENIASVRSFEKAGFHYGQLDPEHPLAYRFILPLQ